MSKRTTVATASSATRILVASDQPLVCLGVEALFAEHRRCAVAGMVGSVSKILAAVENLAPDVLIMDLDIDAGTNREIASALGIGRRTVESHAGRLLGKLGVRNKAELVRHAIVERLVQI